MEKILIFFDKLDLKPVGGPAGYLYTLYQEDVKENKYLYFLEEKKQIDSGSSCNSRKNKTIERIVNEFRTIKHIFVGNRSKYIESNEYNIIHFHRTSDVYKYRKSIKKFKGKVVLTSHCPTLGSIETYSSEPRWEQILFYPVFQLSKMADKKAFRLVDYIVFPCEEAEEPYSHVWHGFEDFKKKSKKNFRYLLTGTKERYPKLSRAEIRDKYNIPETAKVICYVGRHNEIKGYDKLKEYGKTVLEKYSDCYILVAGKEEPIKGLNDSRWIEVGWTDDPHSLIYASDVFILPNKETYFDLILLEVLSLGAIPLISYTGGNKYFAKEQYKGIYIYKNDDEFYKYLDEIFMYDTRHIDELRELNKNVFKAEFDVPVFYKNYLELIKSLPK